MSWAQEAIAFTPYFNANAAWVRPMRKPRFKRKKNKKNWKSIPPKFGGLF